MTEDLTFQERIEKASEEATRTIATLKFGTHKSIVHAAVAYVSASKNPKNAQDYIESIYRAIIDLQHSVILGAATQTANQALQQLLYRPERGDEGWLSPGMRTANEFTKQVIATAETLRGKYLGEPQQR